MLWLFIFSKLERTGSCLFRVELVSGDGRRLCIFMVPVCYLTWNVLLPLYLVALKSGALLASFPEESSAVVSEGLSGDERRKDPFVLGIRGERAHLKVYCRPCQAFCCCFGRLQGANPSGSPQSKLSHAAQQSGDSRWEDVNVVGSLIRFVKISLVLLNHNQFSYFVFSKCEDIYLLQSFCYLFG